MHNNSMSCMLGIQRSIPFPRISLSKLIDYLVFIGDNPGVNCSTIRERGLDIGKGRGDITRFFQRIGLISVDKDCNVRLTEIGNTIFKALNNDIYLAKTLMHLIFYNEIPHYKLLIITVSERDLISLNELHEEVNHRIRELSPTAWLNDVAFKTLIGLAVDLDVIKVEDGKVSIRYAASVSECIRVSIVSLGGQRILRTDELNNCLRRIFNGLNTEQLINNISADGCVEPIIAPSRTNPKAAYLKVLDENCIVRQVIKEISKLIMKTT